MGAVSRGGFSRRRRPRQIFERLPRARTARLWAIIELIQLGRTITPEQVAECWAIPLRAAQTDFQHIRLALPGLLMRGPHNKGWRLTSSYP